LPEPEIDYKEVKGSRQGFTIRKDIVVQPQDCTRDKLVALVNHLSRRFMLSPTVVINIFTDERAAQTYDRPQGEEEREFAMSHWAARYIKSVSIRLNELVIYPDCDHTHPEQVKF